VLRIREVYPGSLILDPDFYPSRIPNLGSWILDPKTDTEENTEEIFFVSIWKAIDEKSRIRIRSPVYRSQDPSQHGMYPSGKLL
jgi:hypothetical protein